MLNMLENKVLESSHRLCLNRPLRQMSTGILVQRMLVLMMEVQDMGTCLKPMVRIMMVTIGIIIGYKAKKPIAVAGMVEIK